MAGDGSSSLYRRARPSITQWSASRPPPAACPPRPPAYTASAPPRPGRSTGTSRDAVLLHSSPNHTPFLLFTRTTHRVLLPLISMSHQKVSHPVLIFPFLAFPPFLTRLPVLTNNKGFLHSTGNTVESCFSTEKRCRLYELLSRPSSCMKKLIRNFMFLLIYCQLYYLFPFIIIFKSLFFSCTIHFSLDPINGFSLLKSFPLFYKPEIFCEKRNGMTFSQFLLPLHLFHVRYPPGNV